MSITSTDVFTGQAPVFRPTAGEAAPPRFTSRHQGMIQELGFKTPFDHADRWQLAKLCRKLGIRHKDGERKVILLQHLVNAAESGEIKVNEALAQLGQIVAEMSQQTGPVIPEARWAELEVKAKETAPEPAAPVVPPSPESELWRFARMTTSELITEGAKIGLVFKRTDKRAFIMEELEKHLKK